MKSLANKKQPEEIKIRCFRFSVKVIKFISSLEVKRKYQSILDQFLRSATSIGANVVEWKSAHSKKILLNFMK